MADPTATPPTPASAAPGSAPPAAPGAGGNAPAGAPMLLPQPNEGKVQSGRARVQLAIQLLASSLTEIGPTTKDGQAVLEGIRSLTRHFGKVEDQSKPLIGAEMRQVLAAAGPKPAAKPPAGGPAPAAPAPPAAAAA